LRIELVEPAIKYATGFNLFYKNYKDSGEKLVPFVLKLYEGSMEDYVNRLKGFTKGIGVPKGFIEHSTFWLKDEKDEIKVS